MIKQLIIDLTYDNIRLSQGLTRAKLIASKIKNELYKNWLTKELEGYKMDDPLLPSYRTIFAPIQLVLEMPTGQTHNFPIKATGDEIDEKLKTFINFHAITEPISIVEAQILENTNPHGFVDIPAPVISVLSEPYKPHIIMYKGVIRKGFREINKIHYQSVIELTKQKLIDTLIELESEFPDLINDYAMTSENEKKVETIITNHIYGNNNPLTIAAGQNVEQSGVTNSISTEQYSELERLGVEKEDIHKLQEIVSLSGKDKQSLKDKSMKWLGGVLASVAGRGLYENIPTITNFINHLTN